MLELQNIFPHSKFDDLEILEAAYEAVLRDPHAGFCRILQKPELWEEVQNFAQQSVSKKALLVIGMGGSILGAKVIYDALEAKSNHKAVYFWDNVDPIRIDEDIQSLQGLGWQNVTILAISKSGHSIEIMALLDYLFLTVGKGPILSCLGVVTEDKPSALFDFAKQYSLPRMTVPMDTSGRFSVLTPVGMSVAAFMGLDLQGFKQGIAQALAEPNKVLQFASLCFASFRRQEWLTVFWIYSESLKNLGFWVQQLWAESLAKKEDRQGQAGPKVSHFMPCVGVRDQHSILQQFIEGKADRYIVFLRSLASEKSGQRFSAVDLADEGLLGRTLGELLQYEYQGTQQSLQDNNISQTTLELQHLSEQSLGYVFMYFQLVVATMGERMNLNSYNQPGVEAGKKITLKLLRQR